MTGPRRTSTLAGLVALLVTSAACSSGGDGPTAGRASRTPLGAATTAPPTPSASVPSPSASDCPTVGAARIPDGTWTGPLAVKVRGSAPETLTRGTGAGQLQVFVEDGLVTGGTWTLSWHSAGPSTANDGQASVTLQGQVAGTVTGTATKPVVRGRWVLTGQAVVTSPVTATAPIDDSGRDRAVLTVRTAACDAVTGTFAPSFTSADPLAASGGTARWVGHPTG